MYFVKELKKRIDKAESVLWEKDIVLKRNEFLKTQGSKDTNIYFVLEGTLRIFLETDENEYTFRFGYPNNFIGALDCFITDQPSDFSIQALKKCTIKRIKKQSFLNFLNEDQENLMLWHQILSYVIIEQGERELDILTPSPVDRYHRVLKRSPILFQMIPNKYIASYLRMTPETLSRIKKS